MSHGNGSGGHAAHSGANGSGGGHSGGNHSGGGHSGGGHSDGGHSGGAHSGGGHSSGGHSGGGHSSTGAPAHGSSGSDGSYAVHLDSLTDFGRELDTQIDGIAKPTDGLASLVTQPMLMGQFGEASSLVSGHQTSVAAMHELLGQVRQAIVFAKDVTTTVASGYRDADSHVAGGLHSDGRDDVTASTNRLVTEAAAVAHPQTNPAAGVTAAVAGIGAAVTGAVTAGVSSITNTVTADVGHVLAGVGQTVPDVSAAIPDVGSTVPDVGSTVPDVSAVPDVSTVPDVGSTVTDVLGAGGQNTGGSGSAPGLGGL